LRNHQKKSEIVSAYLKSNQHSKAFELTNEMLTEFESKESTSYKLSLDILAREWGNSLHVMPKRDREIKYDATKMAVRILDLLLGYPDVDVSTKSSALLVFVNALKYEAQKEIRDNYVKRLLLLTEEVRISSNTHDSMFELSALMHTYSALLALEEVSLENKEVCKEKALNILNSVLEQPPLHHSLEQAVRRLVKINCNTNTNIDIRPLIDCISAHPTASPETLLCGVKYYFQNHEEAVALKLLSQIENYPDFNDPGEISELAIHYFKLGQTDKAEQIITTKLLAEESSLTSLTCAAGFYLLTDNREALKTIISLIEKHSNLFKITDDRENSADEISLVYFLAITEEQDKALEYLSRVFKFYKQNAKILDDEIMYTVNEDIPVSILLGQTPNKTELENILNIIVGKRNDNIAKLMKESDSRRNFLRRGGESPLRRC